MNLLSKSITAVLLTASLSAAASRPEIHFLGANNTQVVVKSNERYLLLPVEDSAEDAKVNVLVDGKLEETIYVRLARIKTDFCVPYDLSQYSGRNVVFDIVTFQSRSSVREAKDDACWADITLSDEFDTTNRETKYRPVYHHTPEYGWMNDPNGMFYKDGKWHLYYQLNPYGSKWQNMTWGHSVSTDLIHWEPMPIAIRPNGLGTVFSGSCAIDRGNTAGFGKDAVIALYTSAGTSQMQSLAYSTDDGKTFSIYGGNPIITLETEARDPNMFWHEESGQWVLVLAHALEKEMLFFTSKDMKNWTLSSSFGKGIGCQEGVWECPDLFELPVEGTDMKKWVLLCNINPGGPFGGSATQYFVGDFDGKTFTADKNAEGEIVTKWLDYGKDHYATVSWSDVPDGRRVVIGWMSNWQYAADVPTLQYRSANTLPREITLFRGADGEIYAASNPAQEMLALRGKAVVNQKSIRLNNSLRKYTLPSTNGGACEIVMDIDAPKSSSVILSIGNNSGEKAEIIYNPVNHSLTFDRKSSGNVKFSRNFAENTVSVTHESDGKLSLRIYVDRSSIEVFGNGGKCVMTNTVFPENPYTTLTLTSEGRARINGLKIYSVK